MVSKIEPNRQQGGAKRIFAAIAIIAAALFLLAAAAPAAMPAPSMQPASTTQNYTPDPTMNTNVSWSTYNYGWSPLEYSNGTGNQTLNAAFNPQYANPISVNPSDIVSQALTNDSWAGQNWLDASNWTASAANGAVGTVSQPSPKVIEITINGSEAGNANAAVMGQTALVSQLPSSNTAYIYETITGYTTESTPMNGVVISLFVQTTGGYTEIALNGTRLVNASQAGSTGTGNIQAYQPFILSFPLSDVAASINDFNNLYPRLAVSIPTQTVSTNYLHIFITGAAITTHLMSLGTTANGSQVEGSFTNMQLASLNPTFSYSSIIDNGYSVAVSQQMQNATEQQTSINDGSYTEQATYQGIFELPTAPDLSYSGTNITVPLTISGAQYEVANLNGVSYLSSIQSKTNGTFFFTTVNPNSQNSLVLEVKYTSAQWDASSSPPSFFSLAGIEYYWWVALLGFMGLIGLGSVAISHFGGEEETLRVPKGKYGR